jgi:Fur family peroxide stress response transcriptional regulator
MMERFESVIRSAGVKLTPQRMAIYREAARTDSHPDIETIHRNVRKKMPGVSLDTVYRTLNLFQELGLVSNMRPLPGPIRFDANTSPHHHFVCVRCGLTRDFSDPDLNTLKVPAAALALGSVDSARLEVRGLCLACVAAKKANRTIGTPSHRHKTIKTRRD